MSSGLTPSTSPLRTLFFHPSAGLCLRSIFGDLVKQHLSWHWAFRPVLSSAARSKSSTRSSSPNYRATTILNNEAKNRRKKRLERYLRVTSELDPSVEILAKGFQQK